MLDGVIELLRERFGLDPTRGGLIGTLNTHVETRLAQLGIDRRTYVERVRDDPDERERLIHAVTVRHSWFYRDPGQLEGLAASLREHRVRAPDRPVEVWIAGCAGGEEAWTVAMIAADLGVPIRMLATDLDAVALTEARRGQYGAWSLRELPEGLRRYLEPVRDNCWRIGEQLRRLDLEFAVHNLCDPPPRSVDIISCRNVLIYFEPLRAKHVVEQLRDSLRPGGELILGAGDLLFQVADARPHVPRAGSRPEANRRREPERTRPPRPARPAPPLVPAAQAPAPPITATASQPSREGPAPATISREHGSDDALAEAGRTVEAGNYDRAIVMLGELVAADPLDAEAHLWTGIAEYGLGHEQLAAEALRRARCLIPQLWPATLFAALTHERRGMWEAAMRCWIELERTILAEDAPPIEGTAVLLDALGRWRTEALSLARQRISKHAGGGVP